MTIYLSCAGFDSDNSSGGFAEASPRGPGGTPVDTSKSNGIGKVGERPLQENGVQKHRQVTPYLPWDPPMCLWRPRSSHGTPAPKCWVLPCVVSAVSFSPSCPPK